MRTVYVCFYRKQNTIYMSKLQFVNKNSCLCIYNYRTLLFCEARGKVNKLPLTNPSPKPTGTAQRGGGGGGAGGAFCRAEGGGALPPWNLLRCSA